MMQGLVLLVSRCLILVCTMQDLPDQMIDRVIASLIRYSASDTPPSALISHADLMAACGEAAKYFKPYQVSQQTIPGLQ